MILSQSREVPTALESGSGLKRLAPRGKTPEGLAGEGPLPGPLFADGVLPVHPVRPRGLGCRRGSMTAGSRAASAEGAPCFIVSTRVYMSWVWQKGVRTVTLDYC